MPPVSSVREYYYWSGRVVDQLVSDNQESPGHEIELTLPTPVLEISTHRQPPPPTRAARAKELEALLSDHIVTDPGYDGPLDFFAATSRVVISPLTAGGVPVAALSLFAEVDGVAFCLYGSAQNAIGSDLGVPAWRAGGWTVSHANGMAALLSTGHGDPAKGFTAREICENAVDLSSGRPGSGPLPWSLDTTWGHYENAEWLARIHYSEQDVRAYRQVHVGTALWVRSAAATAWIPRAPATPPPR
ncbi:MAG: hypothetical protein HOY71_04220, partial [Nonomuraea sp.]|nr:hypothetical protein [Nonomuraea sp.]